MGLRLSPDETCSSVLFLPMDPSWRITVIGRTEISSSLSGVTTDLIT